MNAPKIPGLTLRDYFAAAALQGVTASPDSADMIWTELATWAYRMADAMLAERAKVAK